jgi:hypothetical protein
MFLYYFNMLILKINKNYFNIFLIKIHIKYYHTTISNISGVFLSTDLSFNLFIFHDFIYQV